MRAAVASSAALQVDGRSGVSVSALVLVSVSVLVLVVALRSVWHTNDPPALRMSCTQTYPSPVREEGERGDG
jgi:hypothetical protein